MPTSHPPTSIFDNCAMIRTPHIIFMKAMLEEEEERNVESEENGEQETEKNKEEEKEIKKPMVKKDGGSQIPADIPLLVTASMKSSHQGMMKE